MTTPAISVAMSVYNGERFLDEAIGSVLAQTFTDFEFLILDDGSTDRTAQIIRDHAAADSRIVPIIRENRGLIVSLNQLFNAARAPIVARMDADDICKPERFARQFAFLESHPDYGVVGSAAEDIDENGGPYPAPDHPPPLTHDEVLATIERHSPVCHPAVMVRRDIVLSVGGYHRAFRHCEDYDLWLRLANRTRIGNLPDKLLSYRRYPGQISSRHAIEQHMGAAVALLAYHERGAGRPDPTEHLDALPAIEGLDALFGRPVSRQVRGTVARGLLHSPNAMRSGGFDLLLQHVSDGGRGADLWRTVPRLLLFGEPRRAVRLAAALAGA
ncbi:MAG: glycosyltransferase [Novosphingobium sp.]|nr:glycosyltransferase [Novosphingobium sp.]